jgi:hypothetical protein
MTDMHPRLSRNLAEVIDDLYAAHAPPRDRERMLDRSRAETNSTSDVVSGATRACRR